jgi:hypothetical protein
MTAIIPIPAFADNYIWLLREGGRRRRSRTDAQAKRDRGEPTVPSTIAEVRAWKNAF